MQGRKAKLVSLAAAGALALVDQLIKGWATAQLRPVTAMPLLPGVVELRYILNDGMAFSMLSGQQGLLIGATAAILCAVLVWLCLGKLTLLDRAAWVLILGGGVGNLIDRVCNRVVVDYINLLFMDFAVFNFADICVCTGVGLLILSLLLETLAESRAQKQGRGSADANA